MLIDESIHKIDYTFRLLGLHLRSRPDFSIRKSRILILLNYCVLDLGTFSALLYLIEGIRKGESLTTLTSVSPCIVIGTLSNFKGFSTIIYHKEVDTITSILRDLETKSNVEKNTKKRIREPIIKLNKFLTFQNFLNVAVVSTFSFMPVCVTIYKYFFMNEIDLLLPLFMVYPYDETVFHFWLMTVVFHFWCAVVAVFAIFGSDGFFYICSIYIQVQFRLLQEKIEAMVPEQSTEANVDFDTKLAEIVTWHRDIIKVVNLLETIFSKTYLINFVSSSVMICLSGFNITEINDVYAVSFICFLIVSFGQIFCLCLFGDIVMRSSTEVSMAVYNSKWYLMNSNNAKDLKMILMRAQKPCKVTAYGFADVNLSAFCRIMNTAVSYFTLLKTVSKSK